MAETEEERRRAHGALSERERAVANPHVQARANKPKDIYLLPEQEKYPVKVERDGEWKYDRGLLLAAAREARMHHHEDLARRADEIREREFGKGGEDDVSSAGALAAARTLRAQGRDGAHDSLVAALRKKFATPRDAMVALGLDSALLGSNEEVVGMAHLSHGSARRLAAALKARGMLALDADTEEAAREMEREDLEADRRRTDDTGTDPNAGMPWLAEHREDADDAFETEEERREDEAADRRAEDLRRRLGRDASEEEWERSEEELEFPPDTDRAVEDRRRADDRKRIRADDARRRLGRDESEEEREERECREDAEDRRHARDRARLGRDYRHARDRHRAAMDRVRRAADGYRRADDARRQADDAKRAEDVRRHADDARRHAIDGSRAYDEMCAARDARGRARDARRAHDSKRHAMDNPPAFKGTPEPGGKMISEKAMDQAIQQALRANDLRHRAIAEAVETVRPRVGRIAMDASIESEADVYGRALDILGEPHAGITQLAALKRMFEMASRPARDSDRAGNGFAHDAAPKATDMELAQKMFGEGFAAIERM